MKAEQIHCFLLLFFLPMMNLPLFSPPPSNKTQRHTKSKPNANYGDRLNAGSQSSPSNQPDMKRGMYISRKPNSLEHALHRGFKLQHNGREGDWDFGFYNNKPCERRHELVTAFNFWRKEQRRNTEQKKNNNTALVFTSCRVSLGLKSLSVFFFNTS